jgi:hypothetical protein
MPPPVRFMITSHADAKTLLAELDRHVPEVAYRQVLDRLLAAAARLKGRVGQATAIVEFERDEALAFREWLERARLRQARYGDPAVVDTFARVLRSED